MVCVRAGLRREGQRGLPAAGRGRQAAAAPRAGGGLGQRAAAPGHRAGGCAAGDHRRTPAGTHYPASTDSATLIQHALPRFALFSPPIDKAIH